jgi:hypothetical protein
MADCAHIPGIIKAAISASEVGEYWKGIASDPGKLLRDIPQAAAEAKDLTIGRPSGEGYTRDPGEVRRRMRGRKRWGKETAFRERSRKAREEAQKDREEAQKAEDRRRKRVDLTRESRFEMNRLFGSGWRDNPKITPPSPIRHLNVDMSELPRRSVESKTRGRHTTESLYDNVKHYYDRTPGGIEQVIRDAKEYNERNKAPEGFNQLGDRYLRRIRERTPIDAKGITEKDQKRVKARHGFEAAATYSQRDEKIRFSPKHTGRKGRRSFVTKEHELTHFATDPESRADKKMVGTPIGKDDGTRFSKYVREPIEIDARLAEIKRHYMRANPGKTVKTPKDARAAMSWAEDQDLRQGRIWEKIDKTERGREAFRRLLDAEDEYNPSSAKKIHGDIRQWKRDLTEEEMERLYKRMPGLVRAARQGRSTAGA